jgi:hypothetical protein
MVPARGARPHAWAPPVHRSVAKPWGDHAGAAHCPSASARGGRHRRSRGVRRRTRGLVSADRAGQELRPVVEALGAWGFRHAAGAPRPGESVHPDHVMLLNKVWLNGRMRKPRKPLVWAWRLGEESYTLRFDGSAWGLERGEGDGAAVSVVATPEAWARFLTSPPDARRLPADGIKIEGAAAAVRSFARAHEADLRAAAGERGNVGERAP